MTEDELLPVPRLPDALREAAQLGKLVPFIGAGVSRLAGCPTWAELADRVFDCFVNQAKFNYAQLAQIISLHPRVKLSLALALQEQHQIKIDFRALLHKDGWKSHAAGRRLYTSLSRLGKTFVTTNYDEWLDEELPDPALSVEGTDAVTDAAPTKPRLVFCGREDLTAANLNREGAVIHLHGSVKDPDGMILTTRHYLEHYANDRRSQESDRENPVLVFLRDLFRNKTVLFIGYGLDELEVLEYVILKTGGVTTHGLQPRHFILQGYFSHERELMLRMKHYYRDCGIELLPFLKDERGWNQLPEVLEAFAQQMPASDLAILAELQEMEDLLND